MSADQSPSSTSGSAIAEANDDNRISASPTGSLSANDPIIPPELRNQLLAVINEETGSAPGSSSSNESVERRRLDSDASTVVTVSSASSSGEVSILSVSLTSVCSDDSSTSMLERPTTVPRVDSYNSSPARTPSPLPTTAQPTDQNTPVTVMSQAVDRTNYQRTQIPTTSSNQTPLDFVDVDSQVSDYYEMLNTDINLTKFGTYYEESQIETTSSVSQSDETPMIIDSQELLDTENNSSIVLRTVESAQDASFSVLAERGSHRRRRSSHGARAEQHRDSSEVVPVASSVEQASRENERSTWNSRRTRSSFASYRRNAASSRSRSTSPVDRFTQEEFDRDEELSQETSNSTPRQRLAERSRRTSILPKTRTTPLVESSFHGCNPSDEKVVEMDADEPSTNEPAKSSNKRRRALPDSSCRTTQVPRSLSATPQIPSNQRVALRSREFRQGANEPQTVEPSSSQQRSQNTPVECRLGSLMPRARSLGPVEAVPSLEELERRMANMPTTSDSYAMVEDIMDQPVEDKPVDSSAQNVSHVTSHGSLIRVAEAFADEQERFVEFYIQNSNQETLEHLLGSYYNHHLPIFFTRHDTNVHNQNAATGDLNTSRSFLHFEIGNHHVLSELVTSRQTAQAHIEWIIHEVQSGRLQLS